MATTRPPYSTEFRAQALDLKAELVGRRPWPTHQTARRAIFEWIEVFYNRRRRHSTIHYMSPVRFEESTAADEVA